MIVNLPVSRELGCRQRHVHGALMNPLAGVSRCACLSLAVLMADLLPANDDCEFSHVGPNGSRVRYRVLAFTVALAGITYLDRVCIAQTAQLMMRDLRLTKEQMGFVFS